MPRIGIIKKCAESLYPNYVINVDKDHYISLTENYERETGPEKKFQRTTILSFISCGYLNLKKR